jgi:hypothetical protein
MVVCYRIDHERMGILIGQETCSSMVHIAADGSIERRETRFDTRRSCPPGLELGTESGEEAEEGRM